MSAWRRPPPIFKLILAQVTRGGTKSDRLGFFAALTESLAHCLSNHSRKTVGQHGEFGIHAADFPFEAVDLLHQSLQIDTVKLPFDCRQIVPIAPGLL